MRLTVLDCDPGRKIDLSKERYLVLVDGKEIKNVFSADDEKGEVIAADLDCDGLIVAENGEVKKKTIHGTVEIKRLGS
ncbi:TPA: hypothetical protein OZR82_004775 [Escherichia coli]|uniref:hypothetical protein n=1 Tax=Escherichia coli TaxID=562 RepID=UPI000DE92229|nr:hypothetical protein [Escherichia coli]EMF2458083.1 hypothetical protein [Escherichia coli]MDZ8394224.1 hypothetical protein [Escherichia coli]RBV84078.1 hypothetical protein B9N01_06555 [Escherichia coli]RBV90036.1 hypothetical protein B9N00_03125 [Escherichia coli]GDQ55133.1 hypothetical protein BvCmsOUNP007_02450 [Escherichia coli]